MQEYEKKVDPARNPYEEPGVKLPMLHIFGIVFGVCVVFVIVQGRGKSEYGFPDGKMQVDKKESTSTTIFRMKQLGLDNREIATARISQLQQNLYLVKALDRISGQEIIDYLEHRCGPVKVVHIPFPDGHNEQLVIVENPDCNISKP